MTYILISLALLPAYIAAGWRVRYHCAGGWRVDGPAVVVERECPTASEARQVTMFGGGA